MNQQNQQKQVVIISHSDDVHIEYVTRHLTLPYTVIDPSDMIKGGALSYATKDSQLTLSYKDIVIDNVASVWYRKPQAYEASLLPVAPEYQYYAWDALEAHWHILHGLFSQALWVTADRFTINKATNKPVQLKLAHELGFKTPAALFTSSALAAKAFIQQHTTVIVKTLSAFAGVTENQGQTKAFLASKFRAKDINASLQGLHLAPAIFQEAIDAAMDIRVTVVKDKVFAATITGSAIDNPDSQVRDWKIAHYKGSFDIKEHELPVNVANMCVQFIKAQDLLFGAIDLVLDKNGQYWFLENNPNGQWAFVEDQTKQPIGKAIAELLESPLKDSNRKTML